ncbi:MAG: hypothetical protein AAGE61_07550 [Pseudomonadota bacterium]
MNANPEREDVVAEGVRFSIYRDVPKWEGYRTASIGKVKISDPEMASRKLEEAAATLKTEGFEAIIGPMDGSTWHTYRAVVESDGSQPYMMEPMSGPHDVAVLKETGFQPISHYVSSRVQTEEAIGPEEASHPRITIETFDGRNADALFGEVFDLSLQGFSENHFYKPITRDAFLDL